MNPLPDPAILAITDRRQCEGSLEIRAAGLFAGGCRFLSLREKDLPRAERLALLARLIVLGRAHGATLCIHDDLPTAEACGTALHLPANGNAVEARRRLGPNTLIGQSCHNRAQIMAAAAAGMDYATLSPIFPSTSKPGYPPLANIDIAGVGIPVLALGGVTLDTLHSLTRKFAGIAVMGQAMTAPDPTAWFGAIRTAWASSHKG